MPALRVMQYVIEYVTVLKVTYATRSTHILTFVEICILLHPYGYIRKDTCTRHVCCKLVCNYMMCLILHAVKFMCITLKKDIHVHVPRIGVYTTCPSRGVYPVCAYYYTR